jgi:hypothetical protein
VEPAEQGVVAVMGSLGTREKILFIYLFGSTGVWTQCLTLARQHLSHMSLPFFGFSYLLDKVLNILLGLALDLAVSTYASWVLRLQVSTTVPHLENSLHWIPWKMGW